MDILLFLVLTGFALIMRYALRNVVAGDYKMFFEPWVATLREAGGSKGFPRSLNMWIIQPRI